MRVPVWAGEWECIKYVLSTPHIECLRVDGGLKELVKK